MTPSQSNRGPEWLESICLYNHEKFGLAILGLAFVLIVPQVMAFVVVWTLYFTGSESDSLVYWGSLYWKYPPLAWAGVWIAAIGFLVWVWSTHDPIDYVVTDRSETTRRFQISLRTFMFSIGAASVALAAVVQWRMRIGWLAAIIGIADIYILWLFISARPNLTSLRRRLGTVLLTAGMVFIGTLHYAGTVRALDPQLSNSCNQITGYVLVVSLLFTLLGALLRAGRTA